MESIKKTIKENIKELNKLCSNLHFEFVDGDCGCSVINKSTVKGYESSSFGIFEYHSDDSNTKEAAYKECNAFLQGLLSGTRLLNEKAYHNFIALR